MYDLDWYKKNNVELIEDKVISLKNDHLNKIYFDKAIITTGSQPCDPLITKKNVLC